MFAIFNPLIISSAVGGIHAVVVRVLQVQGQKSSSSSVSILSSGLSALENLAYSDRNKLLLAEAGACECE